MNSLKTTIYTYNYNITNPTDAQAYADLRAQMKAQGTKCFETHGGASHYLDADGLSGQEVWLETDCIFDDQWNTASDSPYKPDCRVFDWAQDSRYATYSPHVKRGHYLVITPEMVEARRETLKCGYCGAHYGKYHEAAPEDGYCNKCLDSEYLEVKNLPLLRLFPVSEKRNDRHGGMDISFLMHRYKQSQLHGSTERGKARIAKKRADIALKYAQATASAKTEHDGFLWLMDKGINTDNVIYYSHTDTFCFGWRGQGIEKELESDLLDVISEFPFKYEIKCADGRKLSHAC